MMMPTPYSILEKSKEEYPLDPTQWVDVFAEIFSGDALDSMKCAAMWGMYHDTGIGSPDLDYWKRCMQMKNLELATAGWDTKLGVFDDFLVDLSNNGPNFEQSSMESESINKRYDPPEVTVSGTTADDYLADQDKTSFRQSTRSGLETETVRAWLDAMPETLRDWALEFRKLFYWGL